MRFMIMRGKEILARGHHHHHHSSSLLVEHRSSTNARHLALFWAEAFASRHVSPLSPSSNILVLLSRDVHLHPYQSTAQFLQWPSSSSHRSSISFHSPPGCSDTVPPHFLNHLGTLAPFEHCPDIPLPNLHTHFWRQQFHQRFRHHSLPRMLIQLGIVILCSCFPTIERSGNTSFSFRNKKVFTRAGY